MKTIQSRPRPLGQHELGWFFSYVPAALEATAQELEASERIVFAYGHCSYEPLNKYSLDVLVKRSNEGRNSLVVSLTYGPSDAAPLFSKEELILIDEAIQEAVTIAVGDFLNRQHDKGRNAPSREALLGLAITSLEYL